ncbi:MAG: hypothetical protein ACRDRL_26225 [Sciscionella sp.]
MTEHTEQRERRCIVGGCDGTGTDHTCGGCGGWKLHGYGGCADCVDRVIASDVSCSTRSELVAEIDRLGEDRAEPTIAERTEQPRPTPRPGVPSVQAAVRADLEARERLGVERYGTPLQPHNGRDGLTDAYEEALDLTCYLRQVLIERDDRTATEPDGKMWIDGDLLRDVIGDACPKWMSDDAARELAQSVLADLASTEGVTVLRGPDSEPWTPPAKQSVVDTPVTQITELQEQVSHLEDQLRATGFERDWWRDRVDDVRRKLGGVLQLDGWLTQVLHRDDAERQCRS